MANKASKDENVKTCILQNQKIELIGLTRAEIKLELEKLNLPGFRLSQIWNWVYRFGVKDFQKMQNLSKPLRTKLNEVFKISRLKVSKKLISNDGTVKWLLKLEDGNAIETVWIPEPGRGTLCISSQIGCTLTCKFCHTGTQRLVRNLKSSEIVGQVMLAMDYLDDWPSSRENRILSNIVLMGMGEPLFNYENVKTALKIIMDDAGISLSRRRITLSTSGIVPEIKKCGEELGVNLAISLHATNDNLRNQLVPVNKKYNLSSLINSVKEYSNISNSRRVTWEYVMLKGVNDSVSDARELIKLIKGIPSKINLIPFNKWPLSEYESSEEVVIQKFANVLLNAGYASPIRTPRGRDVMAACGQLKSLSKTLPKKLTRINKNFDGTIS